MEEQFLKVAVKTRVKTKINILAAIHRKDISVFVGELVQVEWEKAQAQGLVTDAMVPAEVQAEPAVKPAPVALHLPGVETEANIQSGI